MLLLTLTLALTLTQERLAKLEAKQVDKDGKKKAQG